MPSTRGKYLGIQMNISNKNILEMKDFGLNLTANGDKGFAIRNLNISIPKGKTISRVGESGSGKTLTALSILRLHPKIRLEFYH